MNKKTYSAPEMEVVMVAPMQLIAESINVNDTPAENAMESKSFSNFDFGLDEDLTNE